MNHDVMSLDLEGETYSLTCRCGHVVHGVSEEQARERFGIHHRSPDAGAGLAAAREALEGKGKT